MSSLSALAVPAMQLSITLYYLYMIYGTLGVIWFGGKISEADIIVWNAEDPSPDLDTEWVFLNFNDFGSAINSLFGMMALNDW
jgi:hypothetical protein